MSSRFFLRSLRTPLLRPTVLFAIVFIYGAILAYLHLFKKSAGPRIDINANQTLPTTEDPYKRDKKWGKVNFSAIKRKLSIKKRKKNIPDKSSSLVHGLYSMDERKWHMLKELSHEIDQVTNLRKRARDVNHDLDELALLRFLEVSYWKLEKDGMRLVDVIERTITWRESTKAAKLPLESVISEIAEGKVYVRGFDREGRPIIYFKPALEKPPFVGKDLSQLLVYTMERALQIMPPNQSRFAVIVDCKGFSLTSVPPVTFLRESISVMMNHYPMRLGYVRIVNAGGGINFFWKVVASMLQERTTKKISFVGDREMCKVLHQDIAPTNLPTWLCGTDGWTFSIQDYLR